MYPKVITVAQRKGGATKTTTARYVSEYFARYKNKKVLTIDLDNQCNISMLLLNMEISGDRVSPPIHPQYDPEDQAWGGRGSSADLYLTGDIFTYDVTHPTPMPGWEILPGDSQKLYKLEHHEDPRVRGAMVQLLRETLTNLYGSYDLIVIDTGPATTGLLLSAIRAATHVLIPFIPEPQCAKGLGEMLGLIRRENEERYNKHPEVQILGILPSRVQTSASVHQGILESMEQHQLYSQFLMPFRIPHRVKFQEMDSNNPTPSSVFDIKQSRDMDIKVVMENIGEYINQKIFGAE